MIVAKFGGTSVQDAKAMLRSASIVQNNPRVQLVVVSATAGTTNQLVNLFYLSSEFEKLSPIQLTVLKKEIDDIETRHQKIASDLELDQQGKEQLTELISDLKNSVTTSGPLKELNEKKDLILSFGERISSLLFTYALKKIFSEKKKILLFDARTIMVTNDSFGDAIPLIKESEKKSELLKEKISAETIIVTQGFIGKTVSGKTTTIGRGGSDFSAALMAMLLKARELHIWTDVDGVFTIDPRLNEKAQLVPSLTYMEAAELANLGAKILHPLTLTPCVEQKIPIFVGNSFNAQSMGTWIREEKEGKRELKAISFRPKQTLVTFCKIKKLKHFGFLSEIFSILAKNQISVDHVTTSEISTSLTLQDDEKLLSNSVVEALNNVAPMTIERNFGLISLIGNEIILIPHIHQQLFSLLEGHKIRSIFMGASKNNISFLVNKEDAEEILQKIHSYFFKIK